MIVLDICSYTCTYKNVLEYFVLSYIIKIFLTSSITEKKKEVWREHVTFNISSFSRSNSKFSIFFTVFQTTFLKNTFFYSFPSKLDTLPLDLYKFMHLQEPIFHEKHCKGAYQSCLRI